MRFVVVCILGCAVAGAEERCSPLAELKTFADSLPSYGPGLVEPIEKRLADSPDSMVPHGMLVDSSVYARRPVRERYQKMLAEHPESLDSGSSRSSN
ncbi:MAG: hypothetical protein HY820_43380 [Acidobacteria bacterium]|nr:hypothetical protein [Acidobacteriota bacterium]